MYTNRRDKVAVAFQEENKRELDKLGILTKSSTSQIQRQATTLAQDPPGYLNFIPFPKSQQPRRSSFDGFLLSLRYIPFLFIYHPISFESCMGKNFFPLKTKPRLCSWKKWFSQKKNTSIHSNLKRESTREVYRTIDGEGNNKKTHHLRFRFNSYMMPVLFRLRMVSSVS